MYIPTTCTQVLIGMSAPIRASCNIFTSTIIACSRFSSKNNVIMMRRYNFLPINLYLHLESLDDLEKMVIPLFKGIKNKNVPKMVYSEHPWGPEQLKNKIYGVPISDVRCMLLRFPLPSVINHYQTGVSIPIPRLLLSQCSQNSVCIYLPRQISTYLHLYYRSLLYSRAILIRNLQVLFILLAVYCSISKVLVSIVYLPIPTYLPTCFLAFGIHQ